MKKTASGYLVFLTFLLTAGNAMAAFDSTYVSPTGAKNIDYACSPPFLSLAAKPNIHFILDVTGSMKSHPYLDSTVNVTGDKTYDKSKGYWGYFKEDMYYKYDLTANNYWQENPACSIASTDANYLIGKASCVSGKLLNYVTSNKYDIMRKILTGGRIWTNSSGVVQDATVLEHETGYASNITNEPTTNCDYNNNTAGQLIITNKDATAVANIGTPNACKLVSVAISGTKATFTMSLASGNSCKNTSAVFTTTGITSGTQIATSGFTNPGNNNIWTVDTITTTKITVTTNAGIVKEDNTANITVASKDPVDTLSLCKVLAQSVGITAKPNASAKTFTRNDGGSFIADGFQPGMLLETDGFFFSGNNGRWTIASAASSVTASTLTLTSATNAAGDTMVSTAFDNPNVRLWQYSQTSYTRVKSTTAATDFTGLIQALYVAPGNADNKIDMELSFFDTNGIDYTGGSTTNNTAKNQLRDNYIKAINLSSNTGSTTTGPALIVAEKFFRQDTISTSEGGTPVQLPSGTGQTVLVNKGVGSSDPYYEPPASGTATTANSLAAYCRKAYIILVSDGEWNTGTDPVAPAFNMHRRDTGYDLRTETAMQGTQSIVTYTVYAFGSSAYGRNALITTAIFGGFDDIDSNKLPYPFTTFPEASPYSTTCGSNCTSTPPSFGKNLNIGTTAYAGSFRVTGTNSKFLGVSTNPYTYPLDLCNPAKPVCTTNDSNDTVTSCYHTKCAEWDKSPGPTTEIPSQVHTGLPFNYFEATDGAELSDAMTSAVNDILQRTSSSTAASILGNNDNAGASLVQALFYQEKQFDGNIKASWIGEIQSFWYYLDPKLNNITIREDTVKDLALNLKEDKVVQFVFDKTYTKVNVFSDSNGDGIIDSTTVPPTPDSVVDVENVNSLWRGGKSLWSRTASDRLIYTNDPTVTTIAGSRIIYDTTTATLLQPYLNVSSTSGAIPSASEVVRYTRGEDGVSAAYTQRSRQINVGGVTRAWKLGDIINSTPKIASEVQINTYDKQRPDGYEIPSYAKFIGSKDYAARGTVFVGANDGMMHAFKTGTNNKKTGDIVAELKNYDGTAVTDLGKEKWAFVPKNALPYLQYLMLPSYQHIYLVDGTPMLVDAAIGMTNPDASFNNGIAPTSPCNTADPTKYHLCLLRTTVDSSGQLDYTLGNGGTSWRTVLLGSMGYGGASRIKGTTCKSGDTSGCPNAVPTPLAHPLDATKGFGYSSFFALDVTAPLSETETDYPKLLWEFSDPRLGFSTVAPVVLRLNDTNDNVASRRNGRWVVALASGPTGPIDSATLSFDGRSDQPLTIFIVDLKTGALLRTFNNQDCTAGTVNNFDSSCSTIHTKVASMPSNAFGGALSNSQFDVDRGNPTLAPAFSDDVLYIGYTRSDGAATPTWNKGGVLRLLTYNDDSHSEYNPSTWSVSTFVDGIGPVTSSIASLVGGNYFWVFFGTGRYFYKGDDPTNVQTLFGVKDPCFGHSGTDMKFNGTNTAPCTTTLSLSSSASGASGTGFVDQSTTINTVYPSDNGWFINLPGATTGIYPKRVITNPTASTNGIISFVTFTPSTDVCSYGGTSSVWAVRASNGGAVSKLKGQVLVQLSTGAFQSVDVSKDFTLSGNRESIQYDGVPPKNEPARTTNENLKPSRKILHIQER